MSTLESHPVGAGRQLLALLCAVTLAAAGLHGCNAVQTQRRSIVEAGQAATVDRKSPFLKAHMLDGSVYILAGWTIDTGARTVSGRGERLDVNRVNVGGGALTLALDSVALFETNVVARHPAVGGMMLVTGVSLAVTAACLANPKACFGSCPTFYVSDGARELLQAEGFSASIAPALEATDIDALYLARPASRTLEIRMTNEAMETHVVRWAHLLVLPRHDGERIVATQAGEFWRAISLEPPRRCSAREGDCLATVRALDGRERFSTTDSTDLATRELIELEFTESGDSLGLVIGSRQTLLSTFVLYQALAFMGRKAGQFLAALQRGDSTVRRHAGGIGRALGSIEVQTIDSTGQWTTVGKTEETGPLATDVRVVPLPPLGRGERIRLRLTRGHWRIDYLALAKLSGPVEALRLDPVQVRHNGKIDRRALGKLIDSAAALVTYPGDEYALLYQLPDDFARYELFLESRGYYLEWMREKWMKEENPARLAMLLFDPEAALRAMAPEFKRQEAAMEASFWGSRYVHR